MPGAALLLRLDHDKDAPYQVPSRLGQGSPSHARSKPVKVAVLGKGRAGQFKSPSILEVFVFDSMKSHLNKSSKMIT
jgi:hypothetical protein